MIITKAQMEAFAQLSTKAAVDRLAKQARDRLPTLLTGVSDEQLLVLTRRAVGAALSAGINTEPAVWRYFHLVLRCGNRNTMTVDSYRATSVLLSNRTAAAKVATLWREHRALRTVEAGRRTAFA